MIAPPHDMVPGTTEKDYYAGKVSGAVPEQERSAVVDREGSREALS
jgi:hypothetical protein